MSTQQVAADLATLCKQGKFAEAGEKYWADDVLSVEPTGEQAELRGKAAVRGKGEWWSSHHDVRNVKIEGPYVNGDQFAIHFIMDVTDKDSGREMHMDEIGLYTVKNDKIAEERFLYGG
jgi:hypothetical protein